MPLIHESEKDRKSKAILITVYTLLLLGTITQIFPFFWMLSSSLKDNIEIYKLPPRLIPSLATMVQVDLDASGIWLQSGKGRKHLEADAVLASFSIMKKRPEVKEVRVRAIAGGRLLFTLTAPQLQAKKLWESYSQSKTTELDDWRRAAPEIIRQLGGRFYVSGKRIEPIKPAEGKQSELRAAVAEVLLGVGLQSQVRNIMVGRSFGPLFDSYRKAWVALGELPLSRFFVNSLVVAFGTVVWQLLVCSLSAYAISRLVSPGIGKLLLFFFIGTMMIPGMVLTIPNYLILKEFPFTSLLGIPFPHINLLNTFWALILPAAASGFAVYIFKGFFDQLPQDLLDAARIDGATEMGVFTQIAVPLSKPVFAVLGIMAFMGSWNDFMWPFIVIQKKELWTLMVGLYQLQNSAGEPNVVMASLVLGALPVILMFVFFQRYILEGIVMTGLKG